MSEHTVTHSEKVLPEQEQRTVIISSRGAAYQQTWRNIGLIIQREYKNFVTQRFFIISTITMVVLIAIGICVPTLIEYFTSTSNVPTKVVVLNNAAPIAGLDDQALSRTIDSILNGTTTQTTDTNPSAQPRSGKSSFAITIQASNQLNSLRSQVKSGNLPILLVFDRSTDQKLHVTYYTDTAATADPHLPQIQAVAQQLTSLDTAHRLGLTLEQTQMLFAQPDFSFVNANPSQATDQSARTQSEIAAGYIIAYAGNILIYLSVMLYGLSVATGVGEEKSSRIMEVLLNAATPLQLMVGKIIGIGAAGLTQMSCIIAASLGVLLLQYPLHAALLGPNSGGPLLNLGGISVMPLLLLLVYFILGFLLFATLLAAMGALVKRQDEVQQAGQPIVLLLMIGYLISYVAIYLPDAPWVKVVSYVPFWTPTTMLVRVSVSTVPWWEITFTIAFMIVAIIVSAWLSARIYRFGVLMYGQKPGLGQLVKLIRMS